MISIFPLWNLHLYEYVATFRQLIRYSGAYGSYQDFLDRGLVLTRKLLNQWFLLVKLKSSLRKFYERHHDLVNRYVSQTTRDVLHKSLVVSTCCFFPHSFLIPGFVTRRCHLWSRNWLPFRSTWVHGFQWDSCCSICSFMCSVLLFVFLLFFIFPLCCLSFLDLLILIIPFGIFRLF